MSIELANENGVLGQFASNAGYTDLIERVETIPGLKKFFEDANGCGEAKIKGIRDLLKLIARKSEADVASSATTLADLMKDQTLVYITNGTYKEPDEDNNVDKFEISGKVVKVDTVLQLVFGWFSIVTINGKEIIDTQGDIISPEMIEAAAYKYVLIARKGGEMHERKADEVKQVARLVESVVFTAEKQRAMVASLHQQGITNAVLDLGCVGWWGGFKVDDAAAWEKVVSGELKAFSIGGRGKRASR